jgi:hypothetical protein
VSPLLRQCIAHAVEAGRAQGHAGQCAVVEVWIGRILTEGGDPIDPKGLREIISMLATQRDVSRQVALGAENAVERLARELEHPGARLARRVLRAARAAAQAWRSPKTDSPPG